MSAVEKVSKISERFATINQSTSALADAASARNNLLAGAGSQMSELAERMQNTLSNIPTITINPEARDRPAMW